MSDNSETLDLKEQKWMKENHAEVLLVDELYQVHRASLNNFNHLQLMTYATTIALFPCTGVHLL
ncbi:hypothetical protein ACFSRY_18690 [Pontibacter locisalis]|uniref:Uncharacterized protein n=1 Tax=Pontibacter locisalis TaxID=1719035 RepID=A0ABW5IQI0_9BACT